MAFLRHLIILIEHKNYNKLSKNIFKKSDNKSQFRVNPTRNQTPLIIKNVFQRKREQQQEIIPITNQVLEPLHNIALLPV